MGIRMNETIAMFLVTLILYILSHFGSSPETCFEESEKLRCACARNPLRDGSTVCEAAHWFDWLLFKITGSDKQTEEEK